MKKVLVIGASGLVGSRAMELGRGRYEMHGAFNSHPIGGEGYWQLDAIDRAKVFELVGSLKPDFILDTHALHNVDYCESHHQEAWEANVEATRNVAEAAKSVGAKYAFISTDYVYDGKKDSYTEEDKPNPLSYYASTKLAAELVLEALVIDHFVVRTSVIYGVSGKGKLSFALWVADKLSKKEPVKIVDDQLNNPTYADNLVGQIFALFDADEHGLFLATGLDCMSRYDFSLLVAKVFGLDGDLISPVSTAELKQAAPRPLKVRVVTDKIQKSTGIPSLSAEEGLRLLKSQVGGAYS